MPGLLLTIYFVVCLLALPLRPPVRDAGQFRVAGRTWLVPATGTLEVNKYGNGQDWLTLRVGEPGLTIGRGVFLLDYVKPSQALETAYRLQLLSYTVKVNDTLTYSINCTHQVTGTLRKRGQKGYSGTFSGASQAQGGEQYPVQGSFTNVVSVQQMGAKR